MERYRPVKIYMTATMEIFVDDEKESQEAQDQKMIDQSIDFVQCLGMPEIDFATAEFDG